MLSTETLFSALTEAAQLAYFTVRKFYNMPHELAMLEYKDADGKTPVGKADRAAGKQIIDLLLILLPGITLVDEDLGTFTAPGVSWSGWVIYIDSIDGTAHFIRRFGFMLPTIGLTITRKSELVCSLTLDMMQQNIMIAEKAAGAWLTDLCGGNRKRLQVTRDRPVAERIFAEDGLSYERTDLAFGKFVTEVWRYAQNRRTWASCLVHAKYVAQDLVDFTLLHAIGGKWDLGACLGVQEAGGLATDVLTGKEITHLDREFQLVLVSNGLDLDQRGHHELVKWARECYGADYPGFRAPLKQA